MYAAAQAARRERRAQASRDLQARRDRQDAEAAEAAAAAAQAEAERASSTSDAAAPAAAAAAAEPVEEGGDAAPHDATAADAGARAREGGGEGEAPHDHDATAADTGAPTRPPTALPPRIPTAAEMAVAAGDTGGAAAEDDAATTPVATADAAATVTATAPNPAPERQVFMRPNTDHMDELLSENDDDDGDGADDDSDDGSDDGAGGSGRAELGLEAKLKLDASFVSENTPLRRKRRHKASMGESPWRYVKRVRDLERAMTEAGYPSDVIEREVAKTRGRLTHVCTKCWLLMPMGRVHGRWVSSNVTTHFESRCTAISEKRAKVQQEASDRQDSKVDAMFGAPLRNPAFEVPLDQSALAAQARMYIYSRMHISKQHFDDGPWRDTLQSAYEFGGGKGKMVYLTSQGLSSWVRAEYAVFEMYVKFFFELGWEFHEGNAFTQVRSHPFTVRSFMC